MLHTPGEIAKNYIGIGKKKAELRADKMFLLAVMAGIYIAVAGCGASSAACTIGGSAGKLVGACVFPAGLTLVLLAGSELFTGNCLLVIPALEGEISVGALLRNWLIVYLGNFAGSFLIAWMVVSSHQLSLFEGQLAAATVNTAVAKVSMSFGDAFLRGILCNLLVCLAVWVSFAANDAAGKVIALFYPILVFVVCGFEHSVANMFYCPAGLLAAGLPEYADMITADISSLTWGNFFLRNLLPVTLGNILGGSLFVGFVYWWIYLHRD